MRPLRECGRVACLSLPIFLCLASPLSLSLSALPLLPKRRLRNQFRCRPAALGLSRFSRREESRGAEQRETSLSLSLSLSSTLPLPLLPRAQKYCCALSPKRCSLTSVKFPSRVPREYHPYSPPPPPSQGRRERERERERERLLREFRHARRRDAPPPAGSVHLYSLRKVRSRPRSLNSIICGISSARRTLFSLSLSPSPSPSLSFLPPVAT